MFKPPEQTVSFLGDESKKVKWRIIDNYDSSLQPPMPANSPLLLGTHFSFSILIPSEDARGDSLSNEYSRLFQSSIQSSIHRPDAPHTSQNPNIVLQCNEEETQIIVDNFEGEKFEVENIEELKQVLRSVEVNDDTMQQVLSLLDEPVEDVEDSWMAASIAIDEDRGAVQEMSNSLLLSSMLSS
jgi:hypothetical protein